MGFFSTLHPGFLLDLPVASLMFWVRQVHRIKFALSLLVNFMQVAVRNTRHMSVFTPCAALARLAILLCEHGGYSPEGKSLRPLEPRALIIKRDRSFAALSLSLASLRARLTTAAT